MPDSTFRYAIYTRQSAETRDGLSSCEGQFQTCFDFANAQAGPLDEWIGERFDDEGVSGRRTDRPALNRLRQCIRVGLINRVYAVALDRLSRSLTDTVVLLDEFERAGVELHLVHQPQLGSAPEARLLRHILASFAQFEREIISSRIAETRAYLKWHGRRPADPAPYGYNTNPIARQLVPSRAEARRVRAIFRRAANGQTPSEIARRIDHLGWHTRQWVSKRSGRSTGGGRWIARQVLTVLRNPVYIGEFIDGRSTRPGCHRAIVDSQVFRIVQARLDERRRSSKPERHPVPFPLRGKVVCPRCRRRLCTYTITRRRGLTTIGYRYYRCRSISGGRAPCQGVQFAAGSLEDAVRVALCDVGTWDALLDSGLKTPATGAAALARAWAGLDIPTQDHLLARVVETVEFKRRNSGMQITFVPDMGEAIRPLFLDDTADPSQPPGHGESGRF